MNMLRKRTLLLLWIVAAFIVTSGLALSASVEAQSGDPPRQLFLPIAMYASDGLRQPEAKLIAFIPDGFAPRDIDEAFAIQNVGSSPLFLGGWQVTDGEGTIILPDLVLTPRQMIWCAKQADAFFDVWGMYPQCEYQEDTQPAIPDATGAAPNLNNDGDELQLLAPDGELIDAVVYGDGDTQIVGWSGDALQPYAPSNAFGREGQVFYRLFDADTWLPLADTDAKDDWAQGNRDPVIGRRSAYPGWDLYQLSKPVRVQWESQQNARLLIAPDNILQGISELFASAQTSLYIETYEFTHPTLVDILKERARAGVDVRLLLEGSPAGGLTDDSRWAAQQLAEAGVNVNFMVNDVGIAHDRYPYQHSKFAVVDGQTLLVSTENFKLSSMPADTEDGDTLGRRGYAVIIQDPTLVERALTIFRLDDDPTHTDIFAWQADHPQYGAPQDPGYTPPAPEDLQGYAVRYPQAFELNDAKAATLFNAPETSLKPLVALINQAGPGDVILTQQLYEHPYWGPTDSNAQDDPNVRLQALINAARRGATVRILLDDFFDNPYNARSNRTTVNAINSIAAAENLDLIARLGNPSGAGLHAKLHLIAIGEQRWIVLASMNGSEASNKLNREMGLALETRQGYNFLADVFFTDWQRHAQYLDAQSGALSPSFPSPVH